MLKVAVCIPCYGDPKYLFMTSLVEMTKQTRSDVELEFFFARGSGIARNRNLLFAKAIEWQPDQILCLDADHTFPPDTLKRLLAHDAMVVGCNYARRGDDGDALAWRYASDGTTKESVFTTRELASAGAVEPVEGIGMGAMLVSYAAIEKLLAWVIDDGNRAFWPLFREEISDSNEILGEDYYFFRKLRTAGVEILLDHRLSWDVGHIGERVLFPADTELARIVRKTKLRPAAE